MPGRDEFAVEIVHALPDRVIAVTAQVEPGATVGSVIEQTQFARLLPEVDLSRAAAGIFGRVVTRDTPVKDGDRIEIYRPLVADPKQARRERSSRKARGGI